MSMLIVCELCVAWFDFVVDVFYCLTSCRVFDDVFVLRYCDVFKKNMCLCLKLCFMMCRAIVCVMREFVVVPMFVLLLCVWCCICVVFVCLIDCVSGCCWRCFVFV